MGTDGFYVSPEWKALRLQCLKRDRYRCRKCGRLVAGKGQSRVDHVLPRKTHPELSLVLGNLQTLCAACDNRKHSEKGRGGVEKVPIGVDGFPIGSAWK